MADLSLEDVEIVGGDDHPPEASVKLYGPPGTGKTTNSAARVARLIRDYGYTISDVAWATYRRSLAVETLERLADWGVIEPEELADPTEGATRYISTVHAVANRVAGEPGDVVTWGHKKDFCKKRNIRMKKTKPWDDSAGELLFDVFSYLANNLLDPHNQADLNEVPKVEDLRAKWRGDVAAAWDDWQAYKAKKNLIDYWEMLESPLRAGAAPDRDILVVDEYHDATPLMAKVCESWADRAEIVIIAGDPNQVVNAYAGADPVFFERIDLPTVLLDTTWRVPFEHWAVAENALSQVHTPPDVERIRSGPFHEGRSPSFSYEEDRGWNVPEPGDQASPVWFADEYGPETMFLTRTQKQADGVASALESAGVLFQTQNNMDIDGWEPAAAPDDMNTRTALYNALQRLKGFTQADAVENSDLDDYRQNVGLGQYQQRERKSLQTVGFAPAEASALLNHAKAKYLSQSRDETTEIATRLLEAEEHPSAADIRMYLKPEFWDVYTQGAGSVRHLIKGDMRDRDRQALGPALRRNDGPLGAVPTKVYTIHASKGNEAENVVLYDGITRRILEEMDRNDSARRNEWRTWYVGLTRASSNLFVLRGGFDWMHPFLPDNLINRAREGHAAAKERGIEA